jgi:DNA polymerase III epsilon subunit-like protein
MDVVDSEHIKIKHKTYKVSGLALRINKINLDDHHKEGITIKKAIKIIDLFIERHNLDGCTIIGHNLRFDLSFLVVLYEREGREFDFFEDYMDTMKIWRELRSNGHVPSHYKASLKVLANFFGVDRTGAHDALVDCHITANVFFNLKEFVEKIEEEPIEQLGV